MVGILQLRRNTTEPSDQGGGEVQRADLKQVGSGGFGANDLGALLMADMALFLLGAGKQGCRVLVVFAQQFVGVIHARCRDNIDGVGQHNGQDWRRGQAEGPESGKYACRG